MARFSATASNTSSLRYLKFSSLTASPAFPLSYSDLPDDLSQQCDGILQLEFFIFRQGRHDLCEGFDAAVPAFPHQADAFGRRFEADAARVIGGVAANQFRALQTGDDAAHRGRAHLLGVGEFAERFGAAEDEDGECGELGGADVALAVADAQAAKQVDGCGVELVGDVGCCGRRRVAGRAVWGGNSLEDVWIGGGFATTIARGVFGLDRAHGR